MARDMWWGNERVDTLTVSVEFLVDRLCAIEAEARAAALDEARAAIERSAGNALLLDVATILAAIDALREVDDKR